jgi:hypothetical protein
MDLRSVLDHEFGHVLGLAESDNLVRAHRPVTAPALGLRAERRSFGVCLWSAAPLKVGGACVGRLWPGKFDSRPRSCLASRREGWESFF